MSSKQINTRWATWQRLHIFHLLMCNKGSFSVNTPFSHILIFWLNNKHKPFISTINVFFVIGLQSEGAFTLCALWSAWSGVKAHLYVGAEQISELWSSWKQAVLVHLWVNPVWFAYSVHANRLSSEPKTGSDFRFRWQQFSSSSCFFSSSAVSSGNTTPNEHLYKCMTLSR